MNFDNIPRNDMDLIDTLAFLKHYGYFDGIVEGIGEMPIKDLFKKAKQKKFESPNIREAVARFQDFYGITVDGNFGPETMRSMSMPRCATSPRRKAAYRTSTTCETTCCSAECTHGCWPVSCCACPCCCGGA